MNRAKNKIIVTGSAGFIGYSLSKKLLERGDFIIGIDNHNNYYDTRLKDARVEKLSKFANYKHYNLDICNESKLNKVFKENKIYKVVNLAAQAGVRYSMENPLAYINSNVVGFAHILENCREHKVTHLVYASTSSVYGANTSMPFSEQDSVNHPLSLYAASKRSNELMAHTYSYLYQLPTTGLRFFTVYGPWGRPDMAPMIFAKALLLNKKIKVFNNGEMLRDFTFIDDVVEAVLKCCYKPATSNDNFDKLNPDPSSSFAPHRIFNVGNNMPIKLLDFIKTLEKHFNKKANLEFYPLQPGDVIKTGADTKLLEDWICYCPSTSLDEGIKLFKDWYTNYY